MDEFYPVVRGLAAGDRVVTSAQFLIDSETNLQAAMSSMVGPGHGASTPKAAPATPARTADPSQHKH